MIPDAPTLVCLMWLAALALRPGSVVLQTTGALLLTIVVIAHTVHEVRRPR